MGTESRLVAAWSWGGKMGMRDLIRAMEIFLNWIMVMLYNLVHLLKIIEFLHLKWTDFITCKLYLC